MAQSVQAENRTLPSIGSDFLSLEGYLVVKGGLLVASLAWYWW